VSEQKPLVDQMKRPSRRLIRIRRTKTKLFKENVEAVLAALALGNAGKKTGA
jgi:hypothetical protein